MTRQYGYGVNNEVLIQLIRDVLTARTPDKLNYLRVEGIWSLQSEQREEIREVLADEFIEYGLGEDGEPNNRGRLIEAAIDWLGHR